MSADQTDPRFAALVELDAYCASLREARAEVERLRADVARLEADLLEAIGERDRMADHMRTGGGR